MTRVLILALAALLLLSGCGAWEDGAGADATPFSLMFATDAAGAPVLIPVTDTPAPPGWTPPPPPTREPTATPIGVAAEEAPTP